MKSEAFWAAARMKIWFGKFTGKTIDQIAHTNRGLTYLDWARGAWTDKPDLVKAIHDYLSDPAVASELETVLREQKRQRTADERYGDYLAR